MSTYPPLIGVLDKGTSSSSITVRGTSSSTITGAGGDTKDSETGPGYSGSDGVSSSLLPVDSLLLVVRLSVSDGCWLSLLLVLPESLPLDSDSLSECDALSDSVSLSLVLVLSLSLSLMLSLELTLALSSHSS